MIDHQDTTQLSNESGNGGVNVVDEFIISEKNIMSMCLNEKIQTKAHNYLNLSWTIICSLSLDFVHIK